MVVIVKIMMEMDFATTAEHYWMSSMEVAQMTLVGAPSL